jgi:hypothetical protein
VQVGQLAERCAVQRVEPRAVRPQRLALERPAAQDQAAGAADAELELVEQARLADAGLARHDQHLATAGGGADDVVCRGELAGAADEMGERGARGRRRRAADLGRGG